MKHTHFLCGSMTSWASFNISQSQPALACSFMSFESTEIFIKSDILAACFRTLDPFRKSFPSNILTAAFSNMDMAQLNQPHKRSWYLNQADGSTVRGGSQFACHFSWSSCVIFLYCFVVKFIPWLLPIQKLYVTEILLYFSERCMAHRQHKLCWGLSGVFNDDITRAASCVRGVQGGVFEARWPVACCNPVGSLSS